SPPRLVPGPASIPRIRCAVTIQAASAAAIRTAVTVVLETRGCAQGVLMCPRDDDLLDLRDGEVELFLGVEEVRPEAKPDVRAEVAEDLPLCELPVDALEARHRDRDAPAATGRVALRGHLEPRGVGQPDQVRGQVERAPAYGLD